LTQILYAGRDFFAGFYSALPIVEASSTTRIRHAAYGASTDPTMSAHPYSDRTFSSKYERYAHVEESSSRERACLTVRVHNSQGQDPRLTLQGVLHGRVGIYVMHVDQARGITTLQLQARREDLDDVMAAVMRELPRAEFGVIRDTRVAAVH
jgi:hypothetical protein